MRHKIHVLRGLARQWLDAAAFEVAGNEDLKDAARLSQAPTVLLIKSRKI
jgi:hypothetical protein